MKNLQESKTKLPQEIERKFLVEKTPDDLEQHPSKEITQGYIAFDADKTEVRLRKKGKDKYFQTVKRGGGKIRMEVEIDLEKEQFDDLWPTTEGKRVEKTRYMIPYKGLTIELDVYRERLKGLLSAEVEFTTEKASNEFIPPEWFGQEITEDDRYKNRNLALHGLPKDTE